MGLPMWRKTLLGVAAAWGGFVVLTAVFGSKSLTCSDSETRAQVLEIIQSHLEVSKWYQEAKPQLGPGKISEIRTIRSNKDLGRYACAAKYSFEYRDKTRETDFTYNLDYLEDEKKSRVLVDVNQVKAYYIALFMVGR